MTKKIIYLVLIFVSFGCQSVQRFNAHIDREIPVEDLKKDVDFIYKKLKKNHPKLDMYISQNQIDYKFDSLKNSLNKPLKPNDFYIKLQAVVSQLRHGHTDVLPLFKRLTKEDQKRLKDSKGPLTQFSLYFENDSLYLLDSSKKDSILKKGSVLLKIDSVSPYTYLHKYKTAFYGDGFNQSYFQNRLNRNYFSYFYNLENPVQDSVLYTLSYKGKPYQYLVKREFPKVKVKEEKKGKKDSVNQVQKPKVSEKKIKEFKFSENKKSKFYARTLSFPTNDSTFAVLKVSTFSFGKYNEDYKQAFKIIKDHKVKNLVLDLRNNGGGRLADSYQLFSYFVPNQKKYLADQLVVNSSAFQRAIVDIFPWFAKPLIYPISLVSYVSTSRNVQQEYYIKPALSRIKTINPDDAYQGNLYVIINGGSYSASSVISSNLKGFNRAYFVGEETGGDANGSVAGLMPNYKLPHSKLKFQLGTIYLEPNYYQSDTIGHGIYPNKEIKTTFKDRLHNIDPQLRWIISDVKNGNEELKKVIH